MARPRARLRRGPGPERGLDIKRGPGPERGPDPEPRPGRGLALVLALAAGLGAACGEGYDNNDAELAVRQRAKEMCSCIFVQRRDEAYCRSWTKVTPDVAKPEVDYERQRVTATALAFYRSVASFHEGRGCAIDQ